jgi:hypothetical protein
MTGLRAPVRGLHNSGVVTHDGTRNLGKVSVKDFVFVGGFGCAEDLVDQVDGSLVKAAEAYRDHERNVNSVSYSYIYIYI